MTDTSNVGGEELLSKLLADANLTANASAKQGLEEVEKLFVLLKAYNVMDKVGISVMLGFNFTDLTIRRSLLTCLLLVVSITIPE